MPASTSDMMEEAVDSAGRRPDLRSDVPATGAERRPHGAILRLDDLNLVGWALPVTGTQPPVVEVLADGESVGFVRADLDLDRFAQRAGDLPREAARYGFMIPLRPEIVRHARRIEARLANTALHLDDPITRDLHPSLRWTGGLLGQVFADGGLVVTGWARDPRRAAPLLLTCSIDGIARDPVKADAFSAELYRLDPDNAFHGFRLELPAALLDGQPHQVHLEDADGAGPVPGAPIEVRHFGTRLVDHVEGDGGRAIARWYDFRFAREIPQFVRAEAARHRPAIPRHPDAPALDADAVVHVHPDAVLTPDARDVLANAFADGVDLVTADALIETPLDVLRFDRPAPLRWLHTGRPPVMAWRRSALGEGRVGKAEPGGSAIPDVVDFALRHPRRVRHVPIPLAHFETVPTLEPAPSRLTPGVPGLDMAAGLDGAVPDTPRHGALVSIIIPSRDRADLLADCVASIDDSGQPHEILIVDNGSTEPETFALYERLAARGVRILPWPHPFNFADLCNHGAEQARGDTLLFLNNDVVFPEPGWIKPLVSWLGLPHVGAVGNKLVWPNDIVQHAGVRVGTQGLADHVGTTWRRDEPGPWGLNATPRFVDAVTAACMAMPKALFDALGGFDGYRFAVAFNDVDLCLRIQREGRRIVWTPEPWAYHLESASRGADDQPHKQARMARESEALRREVLRWWAARDTEG